MSKAKHEGQPAKNTARVRCMLRLIAEFWLTALLVLASSAFAYAQGAGETRFGEALGKADVEAVRQALKAGADPNERYGGLAGEKGASALYRAASPHRLLFDAREKGGISRELEEKIIAVLAVLFDAGATLRPNDATILHGPAIYGTRQVAKYLLERGANPNGSDGGGGTPVVLATKYGHPDMVNLLIEYGAKPLDAVTSAQILFIEAARRGDLIGMRGELQKGARINTTSPTEETALVAVRSRPQSERGLSNATSHRSSYKGGPFRGRQWPRNS